jgi:hypothetical protein
MAAGHPVPGALKLVRPALEQIGVASLNRLPIMENLFTSPNPEERVKGQGAVDNSRAKPENRVVNRIHRQSKKQIQIF